MCLLGYLRRSQRARMWVTVFSCMGILMSLSAISYFGAILSYIYSYYQSNKPAIVYLDPLWMLTAYQVIAPLGMVFGSQIASHYMGNTGAVIFYVVVNCLAAFSGFYTIREPLYLLGTYGLIQGFCSGSLFNLVWKICMSCCYGPVSSTATGIMGSGTPIGALAISELALFVVNPGNKKRDGSADNMRFFQDPALLSRVPYMFVMNGAFCFVIHLVSAIFLCLATYAAKQAELLDIEDSVSEERGLLVGGRWRNPDHGALHRTEGADSDVREAAERDVITYRSRTESVRSGRSGPGRTRGRTLSLNASMNEEYRGSVAVTEENNLGLAPCEMLKTRTFWNMWILNMLLNVSLYIYMNLYKEFGAIYIEDDALLTNAGVVANILMAFGRPLFGVFVDKYGVKAGLLYLTSSSSILIGFTMLALHFSQPAVFFIVCVLQINSISMLWLVFNYAAKEAFGPAHYSANSGIIFTAIMPTYLILAAVLPWLVANFSMMFVFMLAAIFSGISFFMSLLYKSEAVYRRMSRRPSVKFRIPPAEDVEDVREVLRGIEEDEGVVRREEGGEERRRE